MVPSISGAHVSGVARWLNPHRPLIQLALNGKAHDKFWFKLCHEIAHVLLHSKDKKSVFLDDMGESEMGSKREREADGWAREFLL